MTAVIQTPRRKTDHVRAMMVVSKARVECAATPCVGALAEPLAVNLRVFAALLQSPERGVDCSPQIVARAREDHAKLLVAVLGACRLQSGEVRTQHVAQHWSVARHRVHAPVLQIQQCEVDCVVLRDGHAGPLLHRELRGGVDLHADGAVRQVVGAGDGAVATHHELLAGGDIRIREQQGRAAFGGDRDGRDDHVERPVLKGGEDAVEAGVDEFRFDAELARNRPGDVHVETAEFAALGDAERGIGGVDADPQAAAGAHAVERRLGNKQLGEHQNGQRAGNDQTQHQDVPALFVQITT